MDGRTSLGGVLSAPSVTDFCTNNKPKMQFGQLAKVRTSEIFLSLQRPTICGIPIRCAFCTSFGFYAFNGWSGGYPLKCLMNLYSRQTNFYNEELPVVHVGIGYKLHNFVKKNVPISIAVFSGAVLGMAWFAARELWYNTHLFVSSQLNGSNGEWTNADDLDSERNQKSLAILEKAQNPPKRGKKGKVLYGAPEEVASHAKEVGSRVGELGGYEPEMHHGGQYEGSWYRYMMGRIELVDSGENLLFDASGVYGPKGLAYPGPIAFVRTKYLASVQVGSTNVVINRTLSYCPPLVIHLNSKFRTPGREQRNFDAILRYLKGDSCSAPNSLLMGTYYVYCAQIQGFNGSTTVQDAISMAMFGQGVFSFSVVQRLEHSDTLGEPEYQFNRRHMITGSSGFHFRMKEKLIMVYPHFSTPTLEKRGFTTHFAMCVGLTPFVCYANNGHNICRALSRFFKAREDEDYLYSRQLRLLNLFDCATPLSMADACIWKGYFTTRPIDRLGKMMIPRRYKIDSLPPSFDGFKLYLKSISCRCFWERGLLGLLLDTIKEGYKRYVTLPMQRVTVQVVKVVEPVVSYLYDPLYRYYVRSEWLSFFVTLPHPKKLLYSSWVADDKMLEKIVGNEGSWEVILKMEWAKFKKDGRLVGAGKHLTLFEPLAPNVMKTMFSTPMHCHELSPPSINCEHGKPSQEIKFSVRYVPAQSAQESDDMYHSFKSMECGSFNVVIFSDDGLLVYRDQYGVFHVYETDISSCDASNGPSVFVAVWYILSRVLGQEVASQMIGQCARGYSVHNPSNPSEWFTAMPESFFQYSGVNITTLLNNVASFLIFYSIYVHLISGEQSKLEDVIKLGAKEVGYVLTVDKRSSFNQGTFLKRAFNGQRSWVVLGTIFRSFGSVMGDLTPENCMCDPYEFRAMSNEELFEKHIRARVMGLANEPGSSVLCALRVRAGLHPGDIVVSDSDLSDRYGVDECMWPSFCTLIVDMNLGCILKHECLDAIFKVDYGVC